MNWSHLGATLWLRWRILVNRVRRTRKLGNILLGLLLALGACVSLSVFVLALAMGLELLPEYQPTALIMVWIGLAVGFLFFWMIGLLADLQRSDAMSFKNLLHLPVSLGWVFLYNYLSSFVSLSVGLFLPAMLGLWLAMVIVGGPLMILTLPLILAYFGMITAITYQLRGWLAHMMEDKRRGRNIIAAITVGFVILLQIPNLITMSSRSEDRGERRQSWAEEEELRKTVEAGGPGKDEANARLELLSAQREQSESELERRISLGAMVIPLGWLPYGMRATFEGRWWPGLLCTTGLLAISLASLRRSYRKTMLSIVGAGAGASIDESGGESGHAAGEGSGEKAVTGGAPRTLLVQRRLPFVGERTTGIACMGLRSLLRAPEAKMLLLSPLIMLGLFVVMLSNNPHRHMLARFAPLMSLGGISMGLLSIFQLLQNQFGLDREGFRAFVLSPVPRHQILLGKNLANAPVALVVGFSALVGLQLLVPVDLAHFLGACFQLLSAFLLLCMVGNMTSIVGPVRLKENGLKAANAKFMTIVWQLLSVLLVPLALSPLLLPAAAEFLFLGTDWSERFPIYLALHALGLLAIYVLYRFVLRQQGELLQEREQHILDVLTRD